MNVLIVGGSSGLGLALAKEFVDEGDKVIVTGRTKPEVDGLDFFTLDLSRDQLVNRIDTFVKRDLPKIELLVYAAGAYPYGTVTDLQTSEIEASINVAGRGLIYFVRSLLLKQGEINELIAITSISQWEPMEKEVIYSFVKAGVGHFCNSLSLDKRIGKVLVAAPAGLKNSDQTGDLLSRDWVARQIMEQLDGDYAYKFIKILRLPARVEVAEKR